MEAMAEGGEDVEGVDGVRVVMGVGVTGEVEVIEEDEAGSGVCGGLTRLKGRVVCRLGKGWIVSSAGGGELDFALRGDTE